MEKRGHRSIYDVAGRHCEVSHPGPARSVIVFFAAITIAACGSGNRTSSAPSGTSPAPTTSLRQVSLPDLSSASPVVQSRIRERYASLTTAIQNAGAPAADLAAAYGETGKLLMAAEYLDAAETCLLNAQTLVPTDMRWTY